MAHLQEKLDGILLKAAKLIEQNNQYRKVVQDLSNRIKLLETENNALRIELSEKASNNSNTLDKEKLKSQIDKYLLEIDQSIQWLSDLD
jgi:predicted nuclease with TOPRIM domain